MSSTGLRIHERSHVLKAFMVVKEAAELALRNFKPTIPCRSPSEAKSMDKLDMFRALNLADLLRLHIRAKEDVSDARLNETGLKVHEKQAEFLRELVENIKQRHHV